YSNTTLTGQGSWTVSCTLFQSYTKLDTVSVVTSTSGTDPCFNFTVTNRNSPFANIGAISFQLQDPSAGTIRPSKVSAPQGWHLDSVTSSSAFFHATSNTTLIEPG